MITRRRAPVAVGGGVVLAAGRGRSDADETSSVVMEQRKATMEINRNGSRPSAKGPAEYFTGTVRVDPLFQAPEPARVRRERHVRTWRPHRLAYASARSDPDRHVRLGWAQRWGGADRGNPARRRGLVPARRKALAWRDGDHGDDTYRHREELGGKSADWLEKVSDEQYAA